LAVPWVSLIERFYCITGDLSHERTTTAKNMGILKYHLTSLISYERCWPLAYLGDLIKPNQASLLALIIETSAV
jgi:hypothetical protein